MSRNNSAQKLILKVLEREKEVSKIDNILKLIKESISPFKYSLQNISINYNTQLSKPVSIMGNKKQLQNVFFNIIDNARIAINEAIEEYVLEIKGKIDISMTDASEFVCITISDNGIGIKDDDKPHIFEKQKSFWKAGYGSGLGLELCKKIIEETHYGELNINSRYKVGTKVEIKLTKTINNKE